MIWPDLDLKLDLCLIPVESIPIPDLIPFKPESESESNPFQNFELESESESNPLQNFELESESESNPLGLGWIRNRFHS